MTGFVVHSLLMACEQKSEVTDAGPMTSWYQISGWGQSLPQVKENRKSGHVEDSVTSVESWDRSSSLCAGYAGALGSGPHTSSLCLVSEEC